ncbi:MAG: lipopolysaccharide heptosyltransferase II, partial [Candidatus Omnitrophota bacterium]
RLGLSRYIEFLGHRDDIPQVLSRIDLLVLATTIPEAFGRVIIEANAAGVPVVATAVGGVVEIIQHEKTGLLVAPQEPNEMAQAIIRAYKDPEQTRIMAVAARKRVEKEFNLDKMFERTLAVYHEALECENILILKLGAPGDVVLATPSIKAIRNKFPKAKISAITGAHSSPILMRSPYLDEVITFNENKGKNRLINIFKTSRKLKKYKFDVTLDLQNNLKTHLIAFLCGARRRYGYDNGQLSFLLSHKIKESKEMLAPVKHQQRVLGLLGIHHIEEKLELWFNKEDTDYVKHLLEEDWVSDDQLLVGFNLGSSRAWPTKRWPLASFAKLQEELGRQISARCVLFGTKDELELAGEYKKIAKTKPIDLVGKTSLMELAVLIKRCNAIVSSDSAPVHIAAAVQTPFVVLFGPTDPARHLPPAKDYALIKKGVSCSPCYRRECRSCDCMKRISAEEVFEALKKMLKKGTAG